jgi:hypothetical protein
MFGFFNRKKETPPPAEPVQSVPQPPEQPTDAFLTDAQVESASFATPQKDEDIEYLFIRENPFLPMPEIKTGTFGPLPMRTNSDKLQYGTGSMYLLGVSRRLDRGLD